MKLVLELQDQPSNIKKVTVRHDIVIGRGAECNLRLSAPQISRRHCFLRIGSDGAFISDLDSSNGTTLNGKKLSSGKRYAISDGATIAVGPVHFIARVASEVPVSELLEVGISGDQLEAEAISDSGESFADKNADKKFEATLPTADADHEDDSSMNFAIEQAGASATGDEATADCVVADQAYFSDSGNELIVEVAEITEEDVDEETRLEELPLFDELPVPVEAIIEISDEVVALSDEAIEIIDVGDVIDDDEILEAVEVADDEVIDVLEIVDDEEILLLDEDDIIEVADVEADAVPKVESAGDSQAEDELRDFLQGLD